MSGLIKPLTQRGRPAATRRTHHPAVNPQRRGAAGGGSSWTIFDCGPKADGLFVSSYHEDKKNKYRKQMRERIVKWILLGALGVAALAAHKSRGQSSDDAAATGGGLRSGASAETVSAPAPPPPPPPPTPPPTPGYKVNINPVCKYESGTGPPKPVEKGADQTICGRAIPINLADPKSWPTPHTPSLGGGAGIKPDSKEAVLLGKGGGYGGLGSTLMSVFHAYDVAFDRKKPLYITQDSWALDAYYHFFFGPKPAVAKDDKLWAAIQEALGVKLVESKEKLEAEGFKVEGVESHGLFWAKTSALDANAMRDHRNTVLRKLFQWPATQGEENVCSSVNAVVGDDKAKKYSVIHIPSTGAKGYLGKLNGSSGKDHSAAGNMEPDYVKNILKQTDMMKNDIYPVHENPGDPHSAIHGKLAEDPELKDHLKDPPYDYSGCVGANVYLSVLADVYIGNPTDPLHQWVARMRMALGMKENTFVFTEKQGDKWVSYVNGADNSYLYDRTKLGIFMA